MKQKQGEFGDPMPPKINDRQSVLRETGSSSKRFKIADYSLLS